VSSIDLTVSMINFQLWDLAGIDGLQVARSLFGDGIARLAPFQSLEISLPDCSGAILRLCEGNFRLSLRGDVTLFVDALQKAQSDRRVWVKQFAWLGAIAMPESLGLKLLPQIAIAKPPHRLAGLLLHCAAPARIDEIAVLIWRHPLKEPAIEIHAAKKDLEALQAKLAE
jgi:hypothetical protein